jgi:TRAP-type C4-dicarboxylate transport system permease small subunit
MLNKTSNISMITRFEGFVEKLCKWLNAVAGIGLVAMLVLVIADIIGNKAFKYPIPGGIEFASFIAVVVIAFAIAEVQMVRGHVEVEFLVMRLSKHQRKITSTIINIFGIVLWALICWRSFIYAGELHRIGEVSMTIGVPFYPFVYIIGICSIAVCLVLLMQTINNFRNKN